MSDHHEHSNGCPCPNLAGDCCPECHPRTLTVGDLLALRDKVLAEPAYSPPDTRRPITIADVMAIKMATNDTSEAST